MSDDFEVVREAVMCIVEDDHAGRERLGRDALAALERIRAEHERLAELCKPVVIRELNLETGEVTARPSTHRRDLAVAKAVLEAAVKQVAFAIGVHGDRPSLIGVELRALDLERILAGVGD